MLKLDNNSLSFEFPEVHEGARCGIDILRTLRLPDDNREYPLPPELGKFPLVHLEDHKARLPAQWARHGGVLLPMFQAEALWLNFNACGYPCAIKIGTGKINAISGKTWQSGLRADPQDYVVLPAQPWLDGFSVGKDLVRQFVAQPLGEGFTAEEQLTGDVVHGGIQITVYPMKREAYEVL